MALNPWDSSTPLGTEQARTIDDIFRALKADIEERMRGAGNHKAVEGTTARWLHTANGGSFNIYDNTGSDVIFTIADTDSGGLGDGLLLREHLSVHLPGTLTVQTYPVMLYQPYAATVSKITAGWKASAGSSTTVVCYQGTGVGTGGTSMGSLTLTGGANTATSITPNTAVAAATWFYFDVTAVSSNPVHADVTISLEFSRYVTGG